MKNYEFSELTVGQAADFSHAFSLEDVAQFSKLTGDFNPLHTD